MNLYPLCFANSVDALVPEIWAQESLAILEEGEIEIIEDDERQTPPQKYESFALMAIGMSMRLDIGSRQQRIEHPVTMFPVSGMQPSDRAKTRRMAGLIQ